MRRAAPRAEGENRGLLRRRAVLVTVADHLRGSLRHGEAIFTERDGDALLHGLRERGMGARIL